MTAPVLRGIDDESRQMVLDTIIQLKTRLLTKEKILEFDKNDFFPEDFIRQMLSPEIGLQLLFIPEAYGGFGGGARDCCDATREMSRICLGISTAFFAIQLGAEPLVTGGTEEQKAKWLGAIAAGTSLVAYAVTEPSAGSNVAAITTKAEPVTDESGKITGYVINGTKQFISTGGYADFITLLAKTPQGPTFFVVEKNTQGFDQGQGEEKHGIRASNTSPLTFADVFVPVENLIGGVPGQGLKLANKVFGYTRVMVAAMAVGAAEAALAIVIPYARDRIQFGTPLSEKQGYTHKLIVPHTVRLEASTAYLDEIAYRLDSEDHDLQVEGSIAKYFATEMANKTADDAMQALGGYGYITEFEVEKIKRDVKITCVYEGTSEIQQNIISTFRWKATRKSKGEFYNSIAVEMAELDRQFDDIGARFYGLAANALNRIITLVNDNRLTKKQYIMFALADMMTYVEVGASLVRKVKALIKEDDAEAERMKVISRIFSNEVAQLVAQNSMKILKGSGAFDKPFAAGFLKTIAYDDLNDSYHNIINDMDKAADILFKR